MLKKEGKSSLVVLLLAERARSEGARSTRAIEDRPGHPFRDRVKNRCDLAWDKARPWAKRLSWQTQGGRVK